ncbi:Prepilin signal peptidase PulO-like peptidase [Frankia sp. AiPs1]
MAMIALAVALPVGPRVVAAFPPPVSERRPRDHLDASSPVPVPVPVPPVPPEPEPGTSGRGRTGALPLAGSTVAMVGVVTVVLRGHPSWLPAYAYLAVIGVWLAAIDLRVHRLPDPLVLPSYLVFGLLLGLAAAVDGAPGRLVRAAVAALVCWAAFLALHRLPGGGLGRGDVKLAGLLGLALGWLGWRSVLGGMFAGVVIGGVAALGLLVARRVNRRDRLAYGPFLLAGALLAVVAAGI